MTKKISKIVFNKSGFAQAIAWATGARIRASHGQISIPSRERRPKGSVSPLY